MHNSPGACLCVCRVSGSANSFTALMRVEEADEVDETDSNAATAMMLLSPRRPTLRSLHPDFAPPPELSLELAADAGAEQMRMSVTGSLMHTLQQQDRWLLSH